ncbi:hypoxanthine phosphoribosyltransferase [Cerasicoccus maritimus]|uniref:hypoxanthine phosphoribosyltransferase n=1 Tax=Cerasicoccus maritimus TaxID=490089 RepID=UPI002852ABF3|nr:hypoxanthine phosphoribosyltransferase [Cerasicoccus maritimus]
MTQISLMDDLAEVLVSGEALAQRIAELGETITSYYMDQGIEEIVLVAVTNGSIVFVADLMRQLKLHAKLDCIRVSSYRDDTTPVSEPEIIDNIRMNIAGEHVLLIDDILDTGSTLQKLVSVLKRMKPATLRTCVLLDKEGRRTKTYQASYSGFTIPEAFVVGYGLDFAERYRNLPCIGVLRPELQNPPEWC